MEEFVFDKKRDLFPVDQFGFINLREAYASGVVSGSAPTSADAFNEAPYDTTMSRPSDVFERDRQQKYVRSTLKAQKAAEDAAAAAAAAGSAE